MNTWTIIERLWRHWRQPTHPVYRADSARSAVPPGIRHLLGRIVRKTWRPLGMASIALVMLMAADFLCRAGRRSTGSISAIIFSILTVGIGGGFVLGLLLLIYMWPIAVAVSSSTAIAEERERQTWDVLLTAPFDWSDLLLAKLGASLRHFHRYTEAILWVHGFLVAVVLVLALSESSRQIPGGLSPIRLLVLIVVLVDFIFARAQSYVLAALSGLTASLLAPTRQSAGAIALLISAVMVLFEALFAALVIATDPRPALATSIPGLLLSFITRPLTNIVIYWDPAIAVAVIIAGMLLREAIIVVLWRWLVQNLGYNRALAASQG